MEHLNKPNNNNNNQDDGGDMHRKRPVSADLDELSKQQKTSGISPIQLGHGPYGININQQRFSDHQLGSNFTQTPQLTLNVSQNNLIRNNNLLHFSVYPSHVRQQALGLFQFARAGSNVSFIRNSENPSSNNVVESGRHRENSEGPKGKGCKNCNCKNTKCLNLYCDCYANKQYCSVDCKCQNCENTVENEHGVTAAQNKLLEKNPTAFTLMINGDEHRKGCTCKKSSCEKGYCACKANNVKCTDKCKCINCKNPCGARDYGEIAVPGETNIQAEQDNMSANLPQQQPVPNYGSMENSENQRMFHASLLANLETFLTSQPQHLPSNSYHHPSINNRVDSARMMQGSQGFSSLHNSLLNNNFSSSCWNGTLINENNETNHDTLPGVVHANGTLNTQHLTPYAENLPNNINAPSKQQQQQQQQQL